MKDIHGWAFPDADVFMGTEIGPGGEYQRANLEAALRHVRRFGVAIDGGAHVGTWSRVLSQRFTKVIAIEPAPDTFEALSDNMRRFGCANVELHHAALGARAGSVEVAPLDPKSAAIHNTGARHVQPGHGIPVVRIDQWELRELDFLKLDVEGSELVALQGGHATLKRCRPIVLFEDKKLWTRHFGQPKNAVAELLRRLNYIHLESVHRDQIWGPR